nr:ATP-dependent Clp protease proteolytic subunit [Sanguinaria canadensis]
MPVGVPKVPYFSDDDDDDQEKEKKDIEWVDLYNRLHIQRILMLGQKIDDETSNNILGLIAYLSIEDRTKDIYLFINCPGGLVIPGMAIFDMMQVVDPDVHTICVGIAASMGSFVLSGGTIPKRLALPHSRIMMHQPTSSFGLKEKADTLGLNSDLLKQIRKNLVAAYAQRTGQPLWVIDRDLNRDGFMSAKEAQDHGIIDIIGAEHTGFQLNP